MKPYAAVGEAAREGARKIPGDLPRFHSLRPKTKGVSTPAR